MRKPPRTYRKLIAAIGMGTLVCAGVGACTGQSDKQTARVSESGWGAGDAMGRQLFDTKLRAQRGQTSISRTMADAQAAQSDQ